MTLKKTIISFADGLGTEAFRNLIGNRLIPWTIVLLIIVVNLFSSRPSDVLEDLHRMEPVRDQDIADIMEGLEEILTILRQ